MYELFEFVKLLSVKPAHHNRGKTDIIKLAWKEEGEISFLALLCSNEYILLRYDVSSRTPVIKQLPWLPEKKIASMCFDPTMTWLLIATETSEEIYIIPALSIVDSDAIVNRIFTTDDVTVRAFHLTRGNVCHALWWQTLEGRQVAILATNIGEIVFIDLVDADVFTKVTIDVTITDMSLSQDDLQLNTFLVITTVSGNQWKLLLETKATVFSFSPDPVLQEMGYDDIDGFSVPSRTILDSSEENNGLFSPSQFQNFQPPTFLQPQYARGRHFLTAHCTATSTLQVLSSVTESNPLFVYKLPVGTESSILTDKLIFTIKSQANDKKLIILSNQKSENSLDDQDFNEEAMVQQFNLPEGETLLGVLKKRYPFYYHEHRENEWSKRLRGGSIIQPLKNHDAQLDSSVLMIPVTTHTVLDGCIIVTNCSVYEIRPCISPERLFLHLAMTLPETTVAENLAISVGLDLTSLSELAAEFMLKQSFFGKAMKLYTLSKKIQKVHMRHSEKCTEWGGNGKCPATKRTGGLARYGCISETMIHLRQVLSSPNFELNTWERKFLSNMLLHCFVYQLHNSGQAAGNIYAGLSDFLTGSFSFDESVALNLLADFGEVDLLLSIAKARGLVVEALSALIKSQAFSSVSFLSLNDLVQRGFSAHLLQSGNGSLVPCLPPDDLIRLLSTRPQLAIQNCQILKPLLPVLKETQLLELARIFDPSKSVMRGTLLRLQTVRRRTNSLTSLGSCTSDTMDNSNDSGDLSGEFLINFFLEVVLYLNYNRRLATCTPPQQSISFDSIITCPADQLDIEKTEESSNESRKRLSVQIQPVSCGPKHSAAIRNGDLYTWGRSNSGRLGHGELSQTVCPPMLVETLHILKLKVMSVACGNEHTLALTQQGVYGWGNSKYGQVGVGTRHVYKRPMLLETLQPETVIALDCGHYHSLALTSDNQVYSWGWGVHGQLGHGNPEDCLIPTHVRFLLSLSVVKIAGGYAHSLVLTEPGDVWSFGCGYFGQLGVGVNHKTTIPLKVVLPTPMPVVAIGTKYFHCVAVTASNKVYVWGLHPQNLRQVASSLRNARLAGVQSQDQNAYMLPSVVETTYVHGQINTVACGSLHSLLLTEDGGVYVWGRNLEGQLGTGSRQDERIPKMLTAINDQHMVSIASGGEFNLAFDVDGGVWVWGKNDSGQLGYAKPWGEGQSSKSQSNSVYRRQMSTHASDANIPSAMRGIPQSDTSSSHWLALLSSLNHNSMWTEPVEEECESSLDSLPNLDKLGSNVYDSCVVPVTLKVMENVGDASLCLQKCVDLGNWLTAGHISCLLEDFIQALYYRLKAVTAEASKSTKQDLMTLCAQLVKHHINLVISSASPHKNLLQLCNNALHFWQLHSFPISQLEDIFSLHLEHLSAWLVEVVLRHHTGEQAHPVAPFTSQFSLKVLKTYMDAKVGVKSGAKSSVDWQQLLSDGAVDPSLLVSNIPRLQREKLTPRDRLWTDILRNMKKETGVVTLTHTQLDHLEEQELLRTGGAAPAHLKSVVFTCGHHYSESSFKSEIDHRLTAELTSSSQTKLPNSAMLVKQILSKPGLKPSACPRCILHGLKVV
ncbi:uncharacterized protein LOC131949741 [Physella acuta]|uniref:uncharacterized protein LOC131949741 n=1 Tax=Physella acuta TaxID=109671 RepID=UPI0027DB474F|nr:uncharacterized protein LOC131949741 [Physella acuta]